MGLVAGTGAPCEQARGRTIDESGPGVRGEQPRVTTGKHPGVRGEQPRVTTGNTRASAASSRA